MDSLVPADFAAYFEAIHGAAPFPWQRRLLEQVARDGRWPPLLDLPTGTGKTAAIDVALFHLALEAARPPRERRAPCRIVMVVDRRTVVDQAFRRATTIRHALTNASDGVLATVRSRLGLVCEEPLVCVQLRGGMPRDDVWARRPDQPVVAVSTVDQVGSRLLFRGYGLSDAMRPIHAGLLGQDTLFLLDEVHLSQPFLETLESVGRYRERTPADVCVRWQHVAMSATPGKTDGAFGLTEEDRRDACLVARLSARKPVECAVVPAPQFGETAAKRAAALAVPGRCVGVVVNRVATALEVHRRIQDLCPNARVFLMTGRMRPIDRKDREAELTRLACSGRTRTADASPVVVVATQCIEAGADFDFDALVTECASLDALRQRFGRLNRLGAISDARGAVLAQKDAIKDGASDFVYGEALAATWRWLSAAARDFGIDAMSASMPCGEELAKMLPSPSRAPVMLPAHLDLWSQTAPRPHPDPDVGLWLHGAEGEPDADVQIVWRADITPALLDRAARKEPGALSSLFARVDGCPPSGMEALAVPVSAARAWLAGGAPTDVADVERAPREGSTAPDEPTGRAALHWKGEESTLVRADSLRPGMTLVVSSAYGGMTAGTWDPGGTEPVQDLGDQAHWEQTRQATLRLHPRLVPSTWKPPTPAVPDDPDDDENERVGGWLRSMASQPLEPPPAAWMSDILSAMTSACATAKGQRRLAVVPVEASGDDDGGADGEPAYLCLVLRGKGAVSTEDDAASLTGVEVGLSDHLRGVAAWAKRFAEHCGLSEERVRDLTTAGRWHDAGKVDPRFQRLLRGGVSLYEAAGEPLAKSRMVAADRAARRRAREQSRYPKGGRHELSSVSIVQAAPALLQDAADRDLVLHLIASHHGWCRPFAPVVDDEEPAELLFDSGEGIVVRTSSKHGLEVLDSGIAERFWRLVGRYGWYGLAWMEAILRLADHRRSEWEQTHGSELGQEGSEDGSSVAMAERVEGGNHG